MVNSNAVGDSLGCAKASEKKAKLFTSKMLFRPGCCEYACNSLQHSLSL